MYLHTFLPTLLPNLASVNWFSSILLQVLLNYMVCWILLKTVISRLIDFDALCMPMTVCDWIWQPVIELEMTFPNEYPMKPPFVRVVRPRFKFLTGHITIGGSICMEVLTSSGWSPSNDIEVMSACCCFPCYYLCTSYAVHGRYCF